MGGVLKKRLSKNKSGTALKPRLVSFDVSQFRDTTRHDTGVLVAFARSQETFSVSWSWVGMIITKDGSYRAVPLECIKDLQTNVFEMLEREFAREQE